MPEARELALRALSHRDRSRRELEQRLRRAGVPDDECVRLLDDLADSGLQSDARFAEARARGLASKGSGDSMIRNDLRRHGIDPELVAEIVQALEPEEDRALRIFRRRGEGERAVRYLNGKGFSREALERLTLGDAVD